jgi:hypothetical protein
MQDKYKLSARWIEAVAKMSEFAMGGTQVTVKLRNGTVFDGVCVSNCEDIIAVKGFTEIPFDVNEIAEIYQTIEDERPKERGGWKFFSHDRDGS